MNNRRCNTNRLPEAATRRGKLGSSLFSAGFILVVIGVNAWGHEPHEKREPLPCSHWMAACLESKIGYLNFSPDNRYVYFYYQFRIGHDTTPLTRRSIGRIEVSSGRVERFRASCRRSYSRPVLSPDGRFMLLEVEGPVRDFETRLGDRETGHFGSEAYNEILDLETGSTTVIHTDHPLQDPVFSRYAPRLIDAQALPDSYEIDAGRWLLNSYPIVKSMIIPSPVSGARRRPYLSTTTNPQHGPTWSRVFEKDKDTLLVFGRHWWINEELMQRLPDETGFSVYDLKQWRLLFRLKWRTGELELHPLNEIFFRMNKGRSRSELTRIQKIHWSPSGTFYVILSGEYGDDIKLYRVDGETLTALSTLPNLWSDMILSPNERYIAYNFQDWDRRTKGIRIFDRETEREQVFYLEEHRDRLMVPAGCG